MTSILPLELKGVSLDADSRTLIDDISATVEAGAPTIVLGPNGAGKTLFLKLCHGLIAPTAGVVRWRGAYAGDPRRLQAMVFQRPVMLRRSVRANVEYGLSVLGVPAGERQARAQDAMDRTGLSSIAGVQAPVLSGGEQQRLAIARAWAIQPNVLFLDEPTANLDPTATGQVERIIADIAASGTKIVMATHDLGQARRLAGDVLFLYAGRIVERAPAAAFFAGPRSDLGAAFLAGRLPFDDGSWQRSKAC